MSNVEVEDKSIHGQQGTNQRKFPAQKHSAFRPAPSERPREVEISVDGKSLRASEGELLVEAVLREKEIPHICYHSPLMGPIQTCDTCLVEVNGQLVRSCGTKVASDMQVLADSKRARD